MYLIVALNKVNVDFIAEPFAFAQNIVRARHEIANELARTRAGRIQRNHEFAHTVAFLVLQRLHKRHISIRVHAVRVIDVVEFIVVYLHVFAHGGKLTQEIMVVRQATVRNGKVLRKRLAVIAFALRERLQIHFDLLRNVFPLLTLLLKLFAKLPLLGSALGLIRVVGVVRIGAGRVGVIRAGIGSFAVGSVIPGLKRACAFVIGIGSLFFSRCGFLRRRSARSLLIALLGFICRIARRLLFAARLRTTLGCSIVFLLIALSFACGSIF